jgi:hypothetical protein
MDKVKPAPEQTGFAVEIVLPGEGVPLHDDDGGVHVKVNPVEGITLGGVYEQVAVLTAPAVVADQLVVVVRLLKSAAEAPLKPTCTVLLTEVPA